MRFHTQYKIGGTVSLRLSSAQLLKNKEGSIGSWGGNAQNKADSVRRAFIADEGKILVQVDQAGAEALIVAYLCPKGCKYRELLHQGIKHHVYTALNIFETYWATKLDISNISEYSRGPIELIKHLPRWDDLNKAIKAHEVYYYIGKKSGLSFNYGEHAKKYIDSIILETGAKIRLSLHEGQRHFNIYHSTFPEIQRYHCEVIDTLSKNHQIIHNLFGYPIHLTSGVWNDDLFRRAIASIPQSTVGTITTGTWSATAIAATLGVQNYYKTAMIASYPNVILVQKESGRW